MLDLAQRFDALSPWFTSFNIDGEKFGGTNSYDGDHRITLFFEWAGQPKSILELGSLEGGHSIQLAAPEFVDRLVGLEAREDNIARARLATEVLGRGNVDFRQADLDSPALNQHGRFDAAFCAGLLYHLTKPWRLLEEISTVTDCLFLDTQYAPREDVVIDGYPGTVYVERKPTDQEYRHAPTDVLSGLSDWSFWMTLPSIEETLGRHGFTVQHQLTVPDWDGYGPRVHLLAARE
jgi:hypothetical protein